MPRKTRVALATHKDDGGEPLIVDAELTSTEGLVVHRSPLGKPWIITHAPTGYYVTWARTKKEAHEIAYELGFRLLGGWNREIDPKNKDEVNPMLRALQGALAILYPDGRNG